MGKVKTTLLAILGGIDVVVTITVPMTIMVLLAGLSGAGKFTGTYLIIIGGLSSIFRAIKIGFLTNGTKN